MTYIPLSQARTNLGLQSNTQTATPSGYVPLSQARQQLLQTTTAKPIQNSVVAQSKPIPTTVKITPTQKNIFQPVQEAINNVIKIGKNIELTLTQPSQKLVSPIPQKDIVQSKPQAVQPLKITPNQTKLTIPQLQQVQPSSAQMKVTPQSLEQQKKAVAAQRIPQQTIQKAAQVLKKVVLDQINGGQPFTTLTEEEYKKLDTKQKLAAIGDSTLMALAPMGGGIEQGAKGFSKLAATIGFSTNAVLSYLRDSNHSIKDAVLNPENIVYGLLGGKLGARGAEDIIKPGEHTPQEVIGTVIKSGQENTAEGKALVKAAVQAQKQGLNISVATPQLETFNKHLEDYRSFGGYSAGKSTENAALRDIAQLADNPQIKQETKYKVQTAIDNGEIVTKDGKIVLYRGGNPSSVNDLTSATYDKTIAQKFADNAGGVLHEFSVKPEDIQAFIGKAEKEVLVKNDIVNAESSDTGDFKILNKNQKNRIATKTEVEEAKKQYSNAVEKIRQFVPESKFEIDRNFGKPAVFVEIPDVGHVIFDFPDKSNMRIWSAGNYKDVERLSFKGTGKVTKVIRSLMALAEKEGRNVRVVGATGTGYWGNLGFNAKEFIEPVLTPKELSKIKKLDEFRVAQQSISDAKPELKVSKIAKEIDAKTVEKKLTQGFSELAGYDPITIREQAKTAAELVNKDFEGARAIIRGEKPLPGKLKGVSVIKAMEDYLDKNPNMEVLQELVKSPLISGTSKAAQELRLAAERDPYSPVSIIQKLQDERRAVMEKTGQTTEKIVTRLKKSVEKVNLAEKDLNFDNFLDSIKC